MVVRPGVDLAHEVAEQLRAAAAGAAGCAVVGVRPVTDTVKRVDADGFVQGTVDREGLRTPVAVVPSAHHGTTPDFERALAAAVAAEHRLVELPGA